MQKIVFHLNSLGQGGLERVVSNLSNKFAAQGYQVIVATEWQTENEFVLDKRIRRVHVGLTETDEKKNRLVKMHLRNKYLWQFIKQEKPDMVLAFGLTANYRAVISTLVIHIPTIVCVRTDPVGHYDRPVDKLLIPLLYRRAAGFVFQTEGQRDFFPAFVRKKSTIILNPLHDKYLHTEKVTQRQKVVAQSGRLVDFKNQAMLIRAFLKVHAIHPDYILRIYGGDSRDGTREELEAIIEENHAWEYVQLMGASDSLETELADVAVYAFSSDWEGLPNALIEAMALGLPVVATDCPCGGPRTLITEGKNGLLVPIKNEDALAEGIRKLIEDPELAERLGEEARKISSRVNGEAVFKQWQDYMESIGK